MTTLHHTLPPSLFLSLSTNLTKMGGRHTHKPWKIVVLFVALNLDVSFALNVGMTASAPVSPFANRPTSTLLPDALTYPMGCSRECESEHCLVPPMMRYGKYCGVLYSGCPGEEPCDGLDACCLSHDVCIEAHRNDYLNEECNARFLECIHDFRDSKAPTFVGNTCNVPDVVELISIVIEAALWMGKVHA